jgi:hypothetical protein
LSSLTQLEAFLKQESIPTPQQRKRTLFDISGFPHDEIVISAWYAYFLRANEDHGLGSLFIRALLTNINEKQHTQLSLHEFKVETEVTTKSGKRIDLLIRGIGKDEGKYIIIENKIYHWLHNDLEDYWNSCVTSEPDKCGVILSLNWLQVPLSVSTRYINILHSDLIRCAQSLMREESIDSKYLSDFFIAINNLYKDYNMDSKVLFYYENMTACNRIYAIADKAYDFVINHIRIAAEHLGLQYSGKGEYYRYLYNPTIDGVYYTIIFDNLFEEPKKLYIVIEIYGKALDLIPEIDKAVGATRIQERQLDYKTRKHDGFWLHYASHAYEVTIDDLKNISVFMADKIKTDFSPTFNDILNVLIDNGINTA